MAADKYRVLLEITNALVSNLERDALFKAIASEIRNISTFDRAGITLYDPATDHFTIYALETIAPPMALKRGADIPRQGSGMGWVFDHRQPLYRPRLPDDRGFFEDAHFLEEGLHSVVYLPLMTRDKIVGTFQVAGKIPSRYTEEDIAFFLEVANQLALALDNAQCYDTIKSLRDQLHKENVYLQEEIKSTHNFEEIIGESPAIRQVLRCVEQVAPTDSTVLIRGETGTGKELIARAIHDLSQRKARPLVKVNCAALPAGLVESELFGHEKGAFTGALNKKIGRFELAHQGTIFLDEVGDLPLETQAKLLRVLQEQEFERVGGARTITVDVRVIAATNRDLKTSVAQQAFRADLFYRLNVFPIHVPPLRERKDDIPILARYFADKYMKKMNKRFEAIGHTTMDRLARYPWPGNVRELEHAIERAVIHCNGPVLEIGSDALSVTSAATTPERLMTLEEAERSHILRALELTTWVIGGPKGAAELLKIHPNTLRSRLPKLGIKKPE
jgi:formate hydrogenlyase transcriptional activator